jgi:hypothetical protein
MPRNYLQDAFAENERNLAIQQWMKDRVENIHQLVSVVDVLAYHGVHLQKGGHQEEQLSCPFHGDDRKPSARFYPNNKHGRTGIWCFVCREQWDVISLWKKFNGESKFSELLFNIEKAFGITPPESNISKSLEDESDPLQEEINNLFDTCDNRLREERDQFDMATHLKLGSIVDQLRYALDNKVLPPNTIKTHLEQVLNKIGEKVRG